MIQLTAAERTLIDMIRNDSITFANALVAAKDGGDVT